MQHLPDSESSGTYPVTRTGRFHPRRRHGASSSPREPGQGSSAVKGISAWLGSPLLVVIVGAFLTNWLLPDLTRSWQDHQRELDFKTNLVTSISTTVASALAETTIYQNGQEEADPALQRQHYLDAYRALEESRTAITAEMRANFVEPVIADDWDSYSMAVEDLLVLHEYSAQPRIIVLDTVNRHLTQLRGDLRRHIGIVYTTQFMQCETDKAHGLDCWEYVLKDFNNLLSGLIQEILRASIYS
jgi:hypothetical protein